MRTAKFDRVAVAELTVNMLENPPLVKAKAAFVSSQTGATHGYTTCTNWSPATLAKLTELAQVMEADIAKFHFEDAASSSTPTTSSGKFGGQPQGLGEHLGTPEEEVPQG